MSKEKVGMNCIYLRKVSEGGSGDDALSPVGRTVSRAYLADVPTPSSCRI